MPSFIVWNSLETPILCMLTFLIYLLNLSLLSYHFKQFFYLKKCNFKITIFPHSLLYEAKFLVFICSFIPSSVMLASEMTFFLLFLQFYQSSFQIILSNLNIVIYKSNLYCNFLISIIFLKFLAIFEIVGERFVFASF